MQNNKNIVSIFSTTWGHESLGMAIEDALEHKFQTKLNFIKPPQLGAKSYNRLYKMFPYLIIIPFKIAEADQINKIITKYLYKTYIKEIEELIKNQKPKVVISVYYALNPVLEKIAKKYSFTLINVVTDPRTIHKLTITPNAYNLIFDAKSAKYCRDLQIDSKNCIQSGWFVRKEFQQNIRKKDARLSLGINPKKFTICVIGGSEGTLDILKILPAFFRKEKKLQVIFICGHNKKLFSFLKSFSNILDTNNTQNTEFIIKGFTKNTHKYLQASNLIIGKAGPNLLFESVAAQRPFFAISHISGQEDGNLDIIKEYELGFVEEDPVKAIKLTKHIIDNPKTLNRFSKPLKKLSEYNINSYTTLQQLITNNLEIRNERDS